MDLGMPSVKDDIKIETYYVISSYIGADIQISTERNSVLLRNNIGTYCKFRLNLILVML